MKHAAKVGLAGVVALGLGLGSARAWTRLLAPL
jgi:hypothetical protein